MGSKKRVYFQKQNHMDPTWRRCWERSVLFRGSYIRSYAQVEELILDRDLELIQKEPGYVSSIEQAITIRKYLERNPDKLPLLKQFIARKNIELLGGGELVIDYNMVCGEAIVRNFLYSIDWYQKEFGVKNSTAVVPDTFGVSGQMPQILRKLGFNYVTQIGRVFTNKKNFWRGIDGSLICFRDATRGWENKCAFISLESYVKYCECTICKGSGCIHCQYTGLDTTSYRFSDAALINSAVIPSTGMASEPLRRALEYARSCPYDEVYIYLSSEEIVQDDLLIDLIREYREKGLEISFMTKEAEYQKGTAELQKLLTENPEAIPPEEIDERNEGNAVCTGCYVSRIKLKQLNRETENLLITAEKLATLARLYGMEIYPGKKIERLWKLLNFTQFHDAITSSHIDEAYDEITDCLQDVLLGAEQICQDAMQYLNGLVKIDRGSYERPFVLYNVLSWDKSGIHSMVFPWEDEFNEECLEIVDESGNPQRITEVVKHDLSEKYLDIFQKRYSVEVKFSGSCIPAMGYSIFDLRINQSAGRSISQPETLKFLENEYYKISFDNYGISGIFDKELGREVGGNGVNDLFLEEDFGSPWETLACPFNSSRLRKKNRIIEITGAGNRSFAIIEGAYAEEENLYNGTPEQGNRVAWRQTITLYPNVKRVDFKTEIDWDTRNRRIKVAFPLGFQSENDEAWYEIPFGAIRRQKYEGVYGVHTYPNGDWPALNWVEVYNSGCDYSVALLNKGLPCHRVENGTIFLSVLRSPEIPVYIYNFAGARDAGKHTFEYSLYSHKGNLQQGDTTKAGLEFNTVVKSADKFANKEATLPGTFSFIDFESQNSIISTLKMAEQEEDAFIIRINEVKGVAESCRIAFKLPVAKCCLVNLLEEWERDFDLEVNSVTFAIRPYEIISIMVKILK